MDSLSPSGIMLQTFSAVSDVRSNDKKEIPEKYFTQNNISTSVVMNRRDSNNHVKANVERTNLKLDEKLDKIAAKHQSQLAMIAPMSRKMPKRAEL